MPAPSRACPKSSVRGLCCGLVSGAGGQKEPPGGAGAPEPADHALGRSRGGLTSKFHPACEQGRKPLAIIVTAGQCGDSPQFTAVLVADLGR